MGINKCDATLKAGAIVWFLALVLLVGLSSSEGVAAGEVPCSNEQLRNQFGLTTLPDCRAYEMVSPPYKEGYPMFVASYSADGEHAILSSLANLGGVLGAGESATAGVLYLASRNSSGWKIAPLNPAESEFIGQIPISVEANSGRTLWMQHTPTQAPANRYLYVRSANGVFSSVGPLTPLTPQSEESDVIETGVRNLDEPIGATSDYNHVVLLGSSSEDYWPFDATSGNAGSLYEYSGTGNKSPILVAVLGMKGSEQLIGQCGARLGSVGSSYNALSSDGETIFFTVEPKESTGCTSPSAPATRELYARIHGSRATPLAAETVHVSEDRCTTLCGNESGKNFEGAAENGHLAFFTSTQRLTDDAIDGTESGNAAEGRGCARTRPGEGGCNLYMYNFDAPVASRLSVIAGGEVLGVVGLAKDGSRIYFVSRAKLTALGPQEGSPNLYVYNAREGRLAFVVTLGSEDQADWRRVFERPIEVAGKEGEFLLFASSKPGITADDLSSTTQLFEYQAEINGQPAELVRVTKGEEGYNDNGNDVTIGVDPESITNFSARLGKNRDFKTQSNRLNLAENGKIVFFETAGNLSPRAVAASIGCTSVYEFSTEGELSAGGVHLISDGLDTQLNKGVSCGAQFEGTDATGRNALFSEADALLPEDVDGVQRDIYDARREGGFTSSAFQAGACSLTSCEMSPSLTQKVTAPVSSYTRGEAPAVTEASSHESKATARQPAARRKKLAQALKACRVRSQSRQDACKHEPRKRSKHITADKTRRHH